MFPKWRENKLFTILVAVAVGMLSLYLLMLSARVFRGIVNFGLAEHEPATIVVDGDGKVIAMPDLATINLGVQTEKAEVAAAQKENTEKMNKIIDAIKAQGIKPADIQTTNYQINPQYDYRDGSTKLRGYIVTQNLTLNVRDLSKLGRILEIAGSMGANQVGGLNFTVDKPEMLKNSARDKAISDAKAKAESLAKSLGVRLGAIRSFNEAGISPPILYSKMEAYGVGGGDMPAPSIEQGSLEINSHVTIVYEIK